MDTTSSPASTQGIDRSVELLTSKQRLVGLTPDECEVLLKEATIGRVGFTARGETLILPVNYTFIAGFVLFRSAQGSKLRVGLLGGKASFEIDGWDTADHTGWSVLVKGAFEVVTDPWLTSIFDSLGVEPWADAVPRDNWVRIRASEITGRRIVAPTT